MIRQDIAGLFALAAWVQFVANGVILLLRKRGRPTGPGVLAGAAAAAVLFVGFLLLSWRPPSAVS
jgi:hypothetical protein